MSGDDLTPLASFEHLKGAKADVWLKALGVDFKVIEQSKATSKCRDSALERGVSLRQIVKSIVFVEQSETDSSSPSGLNPTPRVLQAMLPGTALHAPQALAGELNNMVLYPLGWQDTSRSVAPRLETQCLETGGW
jgi:hypothetical protein